jgi:hypothetical protein
MLASAGSISRPTDGRRRFRLIKVLGRLGLMPGLRGAYDFADANCYPGFGQVLNDLSGQGNSFYNGNSSGDASFDMTFNGRPGGHSSAEYFDGGSVVLGAAQPAWVQTVHRAGGKISIAQWTRTTSGSYSMGGFFTQFKNDLSGPQFPGFAFGISDGTLTTIGLPTFSVLRADGASAGFFAATDINGSGNWMFSACAIDAAAGTALIQIDSKQYSGSIAYTTPATTDSPNPILLSPSGATVHAKAALALWDRALPAADVMALYNATKGRFGLLPP